MLHLKIGALCALYGGQKEEFQEILMHQMIVHIFGATSSPSVTDFALSTNADNNRYDFSTQIFDAM